MTEPSEAIESRDPFQTEDYPPLWKRAVAFALDIVIVVALYSSLIAVANNVLRLPVKNSPILERGLSLEMTPYVGEHFLEIVLLYSLSKLVVIFPYFAVMESSRWQGTPGKMALGIKVVDMRGNRLSFAKASGRLAGKLLSGLFGIGYLMAAFTRKRQGLHDILSGTLVINKR